MQTKSLSQSGDVSASHNYAGYTLKFTDGGILVYTPSGSLVMGALAQSLKIAIRFIEEHMAETENAL